MTQGPRPKAQGRRPKTQDPRPKIRTMTTDDVHPNPERFLDLIRRQQRGKLKIYLGFAAGVGKTYEML